MKFLFNYFCKGKNIEIYFAWWNTHVANWKIVISVMLCVILQFKVCDKAKKFRKGSLYEYSLPRGDDIVQEMYWLYSCRDCVYSNNGTLYSINTRGKKNVSCNFDLCESSILKNLVDHSFVSGWRIVIFIIHHPLVNGWFIFTSCLKTHVVME